MENINKWIDNHIMKIILVFLMFQPILDVLTSISLNLFHWPITIGIICRVLFLIFLVYYFIFIDKKEKKKIVWIYFLGLFLYCIIFTLITILNKGSEVLLHEVQNMVRTFYFPIVLILLYRIMTSKHEMIDTKNYSKVMLFYILLIFIPNITHTALASYQEAKVGNLGWFHAANEIGGILSLLFPYTFLYLFDRKNKKYELPFKIGYALMILYCFFSMGTKMTIITLCIVVGVFLLREVIRLFQKKKYGILGGIGAILIVFASIIIILLPKTAFYKNLEIHLDYLGVTSPVQIITDAHILDHFIFSSRLSFLNTTHHNYISAPFVEKIFGIGYIENYATDDVRIKMIEMDPFDIFYRQGIIGFILFFLPVGYIGKELVGLIRKKKAKNAAEKNNDSCFYLSIFLMIFMASFTGHIIVAPAVSIFAVIILVGQIVILENRK